MLPPAEILDPKDTKPKDWVDEPEMDDPEDKKPAGYDDIPAKIPDPEVRWRTMFLHSLQFICQYYLRLSQ